MSTWNAVRSRWSRPWRSASGAREVVLADRAGRRAAPARASSPRCARLVDRLLDAVGLAEAELDDDVGEQARAAAPRRGLRDPVPAVALLGREADVRERTAPTRGAELVGGVGGAVGVGQVGHGSATAVRITSRSALAARSRRAKLSAPWRTSISSPPTTAHSALARCELERRAAGPVDQVHHRRVRADRIGQQGQFLEGLGRIAETDARAVDEQVGAAAVARPVRATSAPRLAARSRRAVPDPHVASPPRAAPRRRRARVPPAPRTSAVVRGASPSAASRPGASVLSAWIVAVGAERQRVRGADRARGRRWRRRRPRAPPPCAGS